jgi:hypothetical protein
MNAIGGHHVKWSKPGSERKRPHVFSHTWKVDPKDKHIHKNKHDHTQTHIYNMFVTVNYSMELGERGKGKKNDRASVIL